MTRVEPNCIWCGSICYGMGGTTALTLRWKSDNASPAGKPGLTHWTNSSSGQQPSQWIRMTGSPEDSNCKCKGESLWKTVKRSAISEHQCVNLRKTCLAIASTLVTVIHNRASPITPMQTALPPYHQCCDFQQKSTKAKGQTGNALAVAA